MDPLVLFFDPYELVNTPGLTNDDNVLEGTLDLYVALGPVVNGSYRIPHDRGN